MARDLGLIIMSSGDSAEDNGASGAVLFVVCKEGKDIDALCDTLKLQIQGLLE